MEDRFIFKEGKIYIFNEKDGTFSNVITKEDVKLLYKTIKDKE